jgi:hypothetical protein
MAQVLLNIALDDNPIAEFALEGEGAWKGISRGVGPGSVSVRFWLPGSFGFEEAGDDRPFGS